VVTVETPSSETWNWREISLDLADVLSQNPQGSLTRRKILHVVDGFTSPPNKGVLGIFIALKFTSPSTGSYLANLGFNGKHANNYTTEDYIQTTTTQLPSPVFIFHIILICSPTPVPFRYSLFSENVALSGKASSGLHNGFRPILYQSA
jgi:hypothetical protein